ncbi:MAG: VWA domain-containing protein [Planctomycetota bacterium]
MIVSPWLLLLLLGLPLLGWLMYRAKANPNAVLFSSVAFAHMLQPTLRQRLMWLPKALMLASLTLIIVGLCRPRFGQDRTIVTTEGIAIELIIDRSPSMNAQDFLIDEQLVNRLTAVKNVASRFVAGDGELEGRTNDLIGLTTFSGHTDNESPLTLDHSFLVSKIRKAQIVTIENDGGTAIGDAIASAVNKLQSLDERQRKKTKSKIAILLTDGDNNAGELVPMEAAELAQAVGIKLYTIGVGTKGGVAQIPSQMGRQFFQMTPVPIDEESLTEIAEMTGGKYFRATDTDSLLNIYQTIDQLEKTKVESNHIADYREWAVQPLRDGWFARFPLPPLLLMAAILLATKLVLERTWLREFS